MNSQHKFEIVNKKLHVDGKEMWANDALLLIDESLRIGKTPIVANESPVHVTITSVGRTGAVRLGPAGSWTRAGGVVSYFLAQNKTALEQIQELLNKPLRETRGSVRSSGADRPRFAPVVTDDRPITLPAAPVTFDGVTGKALPAETLPAAPAAPAHDPVVMTILDRLSGAIVDLAGNQKLALEQGAKSLAILEALAAKRK